MVMERLADFVSKSLEGGEAPAPPPEDSDEDAEAELEVDITALDDKPPPPKRPRNWLLSPAPPHCKREDEDEDSKHGECTDNDAALKTSLAYQTPTSSIPLAKVDHNY
ncbi:unnamed protein product [Plutella xylostella]|uniref:(diamondback moth) hypothetical protein n=1 Tax=Plutella xylostella TaxID=51655 RepID=A0A8S4G9N2_PLUXY|nr:unnamed protein product [Plutella xylostella]